MDIIALFCDIEQFLLIPKNGKNKWVKEAIRQVGTYTSFFRFSRVSQLRR